MSVQHARLTESPEQTVSIVDNGLIHKIENHNPRKVRSKRATDDMRESIRMQGVLQPVLLRPHPTLNGAYQLVAGETRFDLNLEVGRSTIPALIRHISDDELLTMASIENVVRQMMSPIDEGEAAREMLALHRDKDVVCKLLGWTRLKLDGRIHLTHCIPEVKQALCDEEISIGHAERLSSLRPESQAMGLQAIKDRGLSVEDLKKLIDSMALSLQNAVFDTSDCKNCPHNSSIQTSLFDTGTTEGQCLNASCFDTKTSDRLQVITSELSESYHTVAMDKDVPKGATALIVSSGPAGVGSEQVSACESCEHFGALVGSQVGVVGRVTRSVCFNMACHGQKVAAYRDLVSTESTRVIASDAETDEATKVSSGKKAPSPKRAKGAVSADATPKITLERNHKVRREAASETILNDQRLANIVSILSLLADSAVAFKSQPEGWPMSITGAGRAQAARVLDEMSDDELAELQRHIAAKVLREATKFGGGSNGTDTFGSLAEWVAESRKCDLTEQFVLDAEYLKPHVKPAIENILVESGFAADYDEGHGDGAFKKLMAIKKTDILEVVSESDFDFRGYLPKGLRGN